MAGSIRTSLLSQNRKSFMIIRYPCPSPPSPAPTRCLSSRTRPQQAPFAPHHGSSTDKVSMHESLLVHHPEPPPPLPPPAPNPTSLSILPLSSVLRSLAITSVSSSRILLPPSLAITSKLAHTQIPVLSPDKNPILRCLIKHTFYNQFCAGETAAEVKGTKDGLRALGFEGVILGYAREVVMDNEQLDSLESCGESEVAEACIQKEIIPWEQGTLATIDLASPGDFVALKFTGAGSQALFDLSHKAGPSPALKGAIDSICDLAAARGVRLLFDAEQQAVQAGIDSWTLEYMRKYNKVPGKAVVYGTYQAYLKATPSVLASHLAAAERESFTLGVKLVRGAYLSSDPRHYIHDTKLDTDNAYDGIAESLVRRSYGPVLRPAEGETKFPSATLVLASHNQESVRKIQAIRTAQVQRGEEQIDLEYAQLQGMADEVSCELVETGRASKGKRMVDIPKAYKYLVWGTTGECMKYLLRRAQENKAAVQRTRDGRNAMAAELLRRTKKSLGLGYDHYY